MAITGPAITAAILAADPTMTGPLWVQMAQAVGTSVASWAKLQSNVTLKGTVAGVVGGGTVKGKFTVVPAVGKVTAAFAAAGLTGPMASQMAKAVALGVANSLNASAGYQGTAAGAIGGDVSGVKFANPVTLTTAVIRNLAAANITGSVGISFATGVGNGVAAMVSAGNGVGVASGGGGPIPSSGSSISMLV